MMVMTMMTTTTMMMMITTMKVTVMMTSTDCAVRWIMYVRTKVRKATTTMSYKQETSG